MSQPVTSREALLEAATAIVERQGVAALSIRGLARESGTGTGTVYNYFPSKEDLTVAVIEHFFAKAFYEEFCHPATTENFASYCEKLCREVCRVINTFRTQWLVDARAIPAAEKAAARLREHELLAHVREGLEAVFERDPDICHDRLNPQVDGAAMAQFVLDVLIESLRDERSNCTVLIALLRSALYATTPVSP